MEEEKKPVGAHLKVYIVPPGFCCFCICVLCTRSKVVKSETKRKPHCLLGPNDVDSVVSLGSEGKVILNSTYVYYGQNVNFFSST